MRGYFAPDCFERKLAIRFLMLAASGIVWGCFLENLALVRRLRVLLF